MHATNLAVDHETQQTEGVRGRILLVGHERDESASLIAVLRHEGYVAIDAANAQQGLDELVQFSPQLILADALMPGMDSVLFTEEVHGARPDVGVIVVASAPSVEEAVRTLRSGAEDYLERPLEASGLIPCVERAFERCKRAVEKTERAATRNPTPPQPERSPVLSNIVGDHPSMRRVIRIIEQVAATTATVLINGETGTGKELTAAAIHGLSPRAGGPFVRLNCAALAESVLESELFGHERGAFTGAVASREGRFEQANGGTLFLDEVSEIPLSCQVKLLRFLQEREFERVGGNETRRVDVRLIASTHRALPEAVAAGDFREDLFYRLNVVRINLPPLRERRSDLNLLLGSLFARYADLHDKALEGFTDEAVDLLMAHEWPGNVRELENAVERAVVLATGRLIGPDHLPSSIRERGQGSREPQIPGSTLAEIERVAILRSLEAVGGSTMQAASMLGISQRKIQYRLREYGDSEPDESESTGRGGCEDTGSQH